MTTRIKFMKVSDQYKYLADRLVINYMALIDNKYVKHIDKKTFRRELKTNIFLKQEGSKTLIIVPVTHNFSKSLRDWYNENYNFIKPRSTFTNKTNYLPIFMRQQLYDRNITFSDIRLKGCQLIFKQILENEETIKKLIWPKGYSKFARLHFTHSVKQIEICFDISSPAPVEFSKDIRLRNSFAASLDKTSHGEFINRFGTTRPVNDNRRLVTCEDTIDKGKQIIKGMFPDRSTLKVYTKEISQGFVLNRFERTFDDRKRFYKITTCRFSNINEFQSILEKLAQETFKSLIPITNIPIRFTDKKLNKIIMERCKLYFGIHAESAFKDLTQGSCFIGTGLDGKSIIPVQNKARELARQKIFLKRSRRGIYVINRRRLKLFPQIN